MADQKGSVAEDKAKESKAQDTATKDTATKDTAAKDVTAKDTGAKDATAKDGETSEAKANAEGKPADDKALKAKDPDAKTADPKGAGEGKGASEGKPGAKDAEAKAVDTKAEQAGVKAILGQLKAELGSGLKDLTSSFSPRDFSTFSNDAIATPAGTRATVDRLALIDQVLLNGTFPVALTFLDGHINPVPSSVSIRQEFRKLGAEDRKAISSFFLQERLAAFPNSGNTYVQAFESEALANLHKSEAMHMVFDASGKAMVKGVKLGVGGSYGRSSSSEQSSRTLERNLHVSMVREEVMLDLRLPLALIEVPVERQKLYENLVAGHERAAKKLPAAGASDALTKLRLDLLAKLEGLGLLVPTRYMLGGRLTSSTCEQTSETIEASSRIGRQQFTALFTAETPLATGGSAGGGRESAQSETRSSANAKHSRSFALESTGGDSTLTAKPQEWVRSLSNPATLAVIGWQEPVPVWTFFAPALRDRFKAALPVDFLVPLFEQRVRDGMERQEWKNFLEKEATRLAGTSFPSKTMDVEHVSKSFGLKAPKLPTAKDLPKQERDTEYALIGSRVRENRIRAKDGYVITYFDIRTNFDPPGIWDIKSGGLLQNEILVRMESETQHGMHWFIESAQAEEDDFTPPATLKTDIVCLQAFELYED